MADIHPNLVAYGALLIWPGVALYLYSKLPIGQATLWTILGGYLLLPSSLEMKLKMIPAFDKESIPNLAALVCCAVCRGRLPRFFRGFGVAELLILVVVISPFITSMLNTDPTWNGGWTAMAGIGPYDGFSAVEQQFILILPFFLGRQFLRDFTDNADILRVLVIAGLAYSLPMLFEVHMSPQLNRWIYGYAQYSWNTEFRDGGARPQVFLDNGLLVAFFAMTAAVAAAALWRTQARIVRWATPGGITAYLSFVLLLCKSLGALVYGAVLVALVRWASPRLQLRVACVLLIITLGYPVLREANLVPTSSVIEVASDVSVDRARSLNVRFVNEERLLARAWQRKWFGWGRYGRSRIYGQYGGEAAITDGFWIITLGQWGIVGFIAVFGLLALPVFRAAKALKFASAREGQYLSALALIVAINVFDCLPNASITPWSWLLVGALLGRAEALRAASHRWRTETISNTRLMGSQPTVA
jgi:hypothetical protein